MTTPRKPRYRRLLLGAGLLVAALWGLHQGVLLLADEMLNVNVEFGSEYDEAVGQQAVRASLERQEPEGVVEGFAPLDPVAPFDEVDAFDADAMDWSSFFDGYAAAGALLFDANGDGRLDAYFTHNNATWVRPTDADAVIQDKPRISGNGLYLNLGNDAAGRPIFRQVKDLAAQNDTYVEEELLVENFLYPRKRVEESTDRVGRASSVALAVDLNNDGRQDLVVGSILPGMLWSHPKTQRVMGQFVRPVGRQAVHSKTPLVAQGLYFVKDYRPNDDRNDVRASARGLEPVGANSVFLNLGDRDGDGLPEWKDVSRETGLEGSRKTMALLAADFDLDGDLDLFEANVMDMDYWPGGATEHAGAANQLYVNQLAETGELRFVERAAAMNVDGLYDEDYPAPTYYRLWKIPGLPDVYSVVLRRFVPYTPEFLEINGERSEPGQISWAAVTQDVNDDGYPDIWVGNDLGFLRLYVNQQGQGFALSMDHPRAHKTGYWMSFSPADFDGDLREDLFAGNMGGASMNLALPIPDLFAVFKPVISSATMVQQFLGDSHDSMHALLDGATGFRTEMPNKVRHSHVLPPDASLQNNLRDFVVAHHSGAAFDPESIDPYEFTWGSTTIDVQNDGRPDLYWVGCLQGRGGGIFPIMGT
ncbi:MAG: VCBS repeat-containing protein, partial [Rhodothermales bacterium]|nr:VCBS repeat-containing protein [Rhodothermales bacterium]